MTYFQLSSLSALAVAENKISASPGRLGPIIKGIFYKENRCTYEAEERR
jgi:hypothetical protein